MRPFPQAERGKEVRDMKSLIYWMIFQMVIGAWLFVSPFATGFRELTGPSILNMVLGIITVLLGLAVVLYEIYNKHENACDTGEPREGTW
jgi:hypothetical protein